MRCRPATREDIPEITRIVTEGFLDYPLHIMLKPYLYHPEQYPQCLTALNRMLACAYQRSRNAFVVETGGRIVATALMHDRKVGFVSNITSGGYELFRYATPRLIADFANVTNRADQIAIDNGDFDWYLEILSVDKTMRGRGVGRWLVSKVLPDFVARKGGHAYGFVTSTESNARFYLNGGCELLDRVDVTMRERSCPIWVFQRKAERL